jgi:hypothetical protein
MERTHEQRVVAAFTSPDEAERAADRLRGAGVTGRVTVWPHATAEGESPEELAEMDLKVGAIAGEYAAVWVVVGAALGALAGVAIWAVVGGSLGLFVVSTVVAAASAAAVAAALRGAFSKLREIDSRDLATEGRAVVRFASDNEDAARRVFTSLKDVGANRVDRFTGNERVAVHVAPRLHH